MSRMSERDLELAQLDDCEWAAFVAETERCEECEGAGRIVVDMRWTGLPVWGGWEDVWGWCRACEGTGRKQERDDEQQS